MTPAERQAAYRRRNPEKSRICAKACNVKRRYGITLEQRDELLLVQDGCCANPTCRAPVQFQRAQVSGKAATATVDHDHRTGRVRGILCSPCNQKLGMFETAMAWAPAYLESK